MYLTYTKATVVEGVKAAFGPSHREADFRDLYVSIEYPVDRANYPCVWVNFDPIGALRPVGIGYYEIDGTDRKVRRWSFAGRVEFTVAAMSSLERDRLFDAMVASIAFGQDDATYGAFRSSIEDNDRVALAVNYDSIDQTGFSAAQGTPWGSDEMMYEGTCSVELIGEFISVGLGDPLVPVSAIDIVQWVPVYEEEP